MGKYAGLLLSSMLLLHEFGHWLGMRLTGQPSARFMLVPLLGGVAVPNNPHKTEFADAFSTLMGPGISALVCGGLMLAYDYLGVDATSNIVSIGLENAPNTR